eukprot:CAMPEP_0178984324 /NCGR_PEP_ID=MMETSP0795-20121207/1538_1 /TAXON_ID=88552 /ORGANISM="Amoebophrya sp., Strain Ameob2" /LENGTH=515 /DNA_ID=CAMNT_0020675167 /DNA_START=119 /DNA_END=1663 /DNA_ORIENTATION=+
MNGAHTSNSMPRGHDVPRSGFALVLALPSRFLGLAVFGFRATATATPTSNDVGPSSHALKAAGKLIRHEVSVPYDAGDVEEQNLAANEKEEFLATSSAADRSGSPSTPEVQGSADPRLTAEEPQPEQLPQRQTPRSERRQKLKQKQRPHAGVTPARSTHDTARSSTRGKKMQMKNERSLAKKNAAGRSGSPRNKASIVEVSTPDSCPADVRDTGIGDWELCGYDGGVIQYLGTSRQACTRQGTKKGQLNSDGTGSFLTSTPEPFPQYTTGGTECKYQGIFFYEEGGRDTCRRACDRTAHCTHYAHGSDGDSEYCLLYNHCDNPAPFLSTSGTLSFHPEWNYYGWTKNGDFGDPLAPFGVKPSVYKCLSTCSKPVEVTCDPASGKTNKSNKAEVTCSGSSCATSQCCTQLPLCSASHCSGAEWKWVAGSGNQYCNANDGTNCQQDCCEELPSCASTDYCAADGWTHKAGDRATRYCDDGDGTNCQQDCCEELPSCASTDYCAADGWTHKAGDRATR